MRKPVPLTPETVQRTREHFVENQYACIAEAESGEVRGNDLPSYVADCHTAIADINAGKWDHTFTFLQRAHWLQTGDCVALLNEGPDS